MQTLTLTRPDDWHLHLRDGAALAAVLPHSARQFARAIVMPNLKPPVTTVALAQAYRERILAALPADSRFEPLMTLYLTDNTTPEEIALAQASGVVRAVKYYPAGATTNADSGVTRLEHCFRALEAMEKADLPLLLHGEATDPGVDAFDREAVFLDTVLPQITRRFAGLRLVLEHITTREAAEYVSAAPVDESQCDVCRRHPPASLLPASAQARNAPPGAGAGRNRRQPQVFSRHGQRTACAPRQGGRVRPRGHLQRARGD
jgi:dihydroorotase